LDNVDSQQEERKSQLAEFLINSYALETEKAKETSEFMVEAEKLFLQQFLKQQIEQTSVTDFYQNLCELLDQYLYFIPTVNSEKDSPNEEKQVEQKSTELQNNEVTDSGEADSGNTNETTASEETEEAETSEAEPDWGDAFAESGDEIDEETKAGYETELKKD